MSNEVDPTMHANVELQAIADMLTHANIPLFNESGKQDGTVDLTCECVWSALQYMGNNPNASILDACEFAFDEWIK